MTSPYLEVTYRNGKPFVAYLYLDRRDGDKSARTKEHGPWVVDFAADGRVIGIEFLQVSSVDIDELNRLLVTLNQPALSSADLQPLIAA